MRMGVILLEVVTFPLLVFLLFGGPMVLADWVRTRRQERVRRQIAITEAIDGQYGSMVAPLVTKPLWGPWQIRMAVPFSRPAAVGGILAIAHDVLSIAERMNPGRYEIVLTPKEVGIHQEMRARADQAVRWSRETRIAA